MKEIDSKPPDIIVRGKADGFLQEVTSGAYRFQVDEPVSYGGTDAAPTPYDYLLAALGSCTSMTIGLYARRMKWPLEEVAISMRHSRLHAKDCADCDTKEGMLDHIELEISLTGKLTAEQHAKLMEIAQKCPVHRTLKSEIKIELQGRKNSQETAASNE